MMMGSNRFRCSTQWRLELEDYKHNAHQEPDACSQNLGDGRNTCHIQSHS